MFTAAGATDDCRPGNSPKQQLSGCITPPRAGGNGELQYSAIQPYYCHTSPVHGLLDDEQLLREAALPQLPLTAGCAKDKAWMINNNNNNCSTSTTMCTPAVVNNIRTNADSCCVPTSSDNCHGPATTACLKQPAQKHMFLKSCEVWHCKGCCAKERDHAILESELLLQRACIQPLRESRCMSS